MNPSICQIDGLELRIQVFVDTFIVISCCLVCSFAEERKGDQRR